MTKYLAVVSSKAEIQALEKFSNEKLASEDTVMLIVHPYAQGQQAQIPGIEPKNTDSFLTLEEKIEIEKERFRLVRNWFKFDREFEQELLHKGIQLGELPLGEVDVFFRENLRFLKGLLNAIKSERPDVVLTGKGSVAGNAVRAIAGKNEIKIIRYFEVGKQKLFPKFPNLTARKISESGKKLSKIAKSIGKPKGKKTIFVSSRGYIDEVEQRLMAMKQFRVVRLENMLLKQSLNPATAIKPVLGKKGLQRKFSRAFESYKQTRGFMENMVFEGMDIGKLFEFKMQQFAILNFPEFVSLIERTEALFE
ncbi:MAG: hypothetical protein JW744_04540, partial [Candidatus Diapherotrites archaeon]|nr:hypothetical protein [Candidatus Diapherotrites archaeon]